MFSKGLVHIFLFAFYSADSCHWELILTLHPCLRTTLPCVALQCVDMQYCPVLCGKIRFFFLNCTTHQCGGMNGTQKTIVSYIPLVVICIYPAWKNTGHRTIEQASKVITNQLPVYINLLIWTLVKARTVVLSKQSTCTVSTMRCMGRINTLSKEIWPICGL